MFMESKESVKEWLEKFHDFKATEWALLPDIELYMDQVTNYLRRQLFLQEKDEANPIITPNMVNNYVKGGHIERTNQKRYNKDQLAALYMLCSMKQSLSISDASLLLSLLKEERSYEQLYTEFIAIQKNIAANISEKVPKDDDLQKNELLTLALSLALSSVAEQLVAQKILSLFYPEQKQEEKKKEKDEKDKKDKTAKKADKKKEKTKEKEKSSENQEASDKDNK
ncbi:MAG: DUF1836 domain-containing protein [Ruminococcaceae bacterium]|nr:DUF1836 domain-containing protein [Oscillospiraceae bacterium]